MEMSNAHFPWKMGSPSQSRAGAHGSSVKSEPVLANYIGSKGQIVPLRHYFTLDAGADASVVSHHERQIEATPAQPASKERGSPVSEQRRNDFTSFPLLSARAEDAMNATWTKTSTQRSSSATLTNHSDVVPEGSVQGIQERVSLLDVQQQFSPIKAMRWCVRGTIQGVDEVKVRGRGKNLSVGGVALCRNSLCPFCSYKRSMESADILSKGLRQAKTRGYFTRLLTFTIPTGGEYPQQRALLAGALREFSKRASREFKKRGAKEFGLSWSFDITMKHDRYWRSHLHIHSVLVASSGSAAEGEMFEWWNAAVQKASDKPVTLSRKAFYARAPHSEKSVSSYVLGKFLRSALEVQGSTQKNGNKVGGGLAWREFLRYIKATGDLGAAMLYKDVLSANKGKWWSSVGRTIKALAHDQEQDDQKVSAPEVVVQEQADEVEVAIYAPFWSSLARIPAGISTLLYIVEQRGRHPSKFEFLRGWVEKMNASKWLTDQEVEDAWRFALGL